MTPYRLQHDALFRTVADILVRDYIAPSETADTVAEWCKKYFISLNIFTLRKERDYRFTLMEPSELAALIADVEGYEKR